MGASSSSLKRLNDLVNELITSDNVFRNPTYNFLDKKACDTYTMVLESDLKKHLKVELQTIKDTIYLVPKKDMVTINATVKKKEELCEMISSHYKRIIKLLSLIKYVYDSEQNGEFSIAGILLRNIVMSGKNMNVSFCDVAQRQVNKKTVDFKGLAGLEYFCEHVLTPVQKKILISNMKNLLNLSDGDQKNKKMRSLVAHMYCGDDLLSEKDYKQVMNDAAGKCNPKTKTKFNEWANEKVEEDYEFMISKMNSIFHYNTCHQQNGYLIDTTLNNKNVKRLVASYKLMNKEYVDNINVVLQNVMKMVSKKDGRFELNEISYSELNEIENNVIRTVAKFFMQFIVRYHHLLELARNCPHVIIKLK